MNTNTHIYFFTKMIYETFMHDSITHHWARKDMNRRKQKCESQKART